MFKAVLIEDEIVIRENIRENFPWAENGIVLAGEAGDGEAALHLIEDVNPQIVITDIKMPFLNGLDLSRIILNQMPGIKVIIMTGHDDFELAQQALKIGVSDYLLKPVGMQELSASLLKVISRIQEEATLLENTERLQEKMEINQKYLQNELVGNVLAGVLTVREILENAEALDVPIMAKAYAVVVLTLGFVQSSGVTKSEELIKAASILEALPRNEVLVHRVNLKEYILLLKTEEGQSLQNDCYRISQSIKRELERKSEVLVSLSIGGVRTRLADIHESYDEAQKAQKLSYLFGKNKIVGLEDMRLVNPYQGSKIPFEREEIATFLRTGMKDELGPFIERHIHRLETFPSNLFFILLSRFNVLYETTIFLEEIGCYKDFPQAGAHPELLSVDNTQVLTVEELASQAMRLLAYALTKREEQKANKYELLITKVKAYINENYHLRTLQLSDVASHVNMSSSHLSTIFNQETGMSYTEYLSEVRIARAKELLATSTLRSAEISYEVGFNDPHYFYNIFKKVTGMTSSAYRTSVSGV